MHSSTEESRSRRRRIEKRKKDKRLIKILLSVGILLVIGVIGLSTFDSPSETIEETQETNQSTNEVKENIEVDNSINNNENSKDTLSPGDEEITENENEQELVIEKVDASDDLVLEAYTANWKPVGTAQQEPHTVNFNEDSVDRNEMRRAITLATNLNEDNLIEWWIENGGEQKVIATVSDKNEAQIYRVYLSWISNHGWQPTKVELLKENDKKTT